MSDSNPEIQPKKPKRGPAPLLAIAFLYLIGFFIVRGDYNTSSFGGIVMVIIGWLFLTASLLLAVRVLFRLFKENFKRKN